MKKLVYPGTFDPITLGHVDLILRASHFCEQLIVAVAASDRKQPYFSIEERLSVCRELFSDHRQIFVESYEGTLINFLKQHEVSIILRGLRSEADVDFEFQLAGINRRLYPTCETVFIKASEETAFISSSIVKEVASMGGDVSMFVPKAVLKLWH